MDHSLETNTLTEYNIFQEKAWQKFTLKVTLVLTEFSSHISLGDEIAKLCSMTGTHFIFLVGIEA